MQYKYNNCNCASSLIQMGKKLDSMAPLLRLTGTVATPPPLRLVAKVATLPSFRPAGIDAMPPPLAI